MFGRQLALIIGITNSSACSSAEKTEVHWGRVGECEVVTHEAASLTPSMGLEP